MINKFIYLFLYLQFSLFYSCSSFSTEKFNENERLLIMKDAQTKSMNVVKNNTKEGNRFLRLKAKDILVKSEITAHLIKRMMETLKKEKGVGIAGPQVGISRKIIWVKRFDKKDNPFEVYLNPKITKYSKETKIGWEGCLSIPAGFGKVRRSKEIIIEYDSSKGEHFKETIKGFTAVIFQHEIDHLNGILFIDRKEKGTLVPKEKYRKLRELEKKKIDKS